MTTQTVTSITNFILAAEIFFLSGLFFARPHQPFSPAWFWAASMLLMGASMLIGGIDHGFIEPGYPAGVINPVTRLNWSLTGLMTLAVFAAAARQFFKPGTARILLAIAVVQLVVFLIVMFNTQTFTVVILNYAPVLILLLVCSIAGLSSGAGSWAMIIGILISFFASALQAFGVDALAPLDRNGLYHVVLMLAVLFLYWGGAQFKMTV